MNPTASFTADSARDDAFFRIVRHLFSSSFLFSASTLLATYDDEPPYVPPEPRDAAGDDPERAGVTAQRSGAKRQQPLSNVLHDQTTHGQARRARCCSPA